MRKLKWIVAASLATAMLLPATASAALSAHGSVSQVYVTGANPGESVTLFDRKGKKVKQLGVGELGGVVFRRIAPGNGYKVRAADGTISAPVTVMVDKNAPPTTDVYNQTLPDNGYTYITTRDGTTLAASVRVPTLAAPPWPTLVEYSGYGYARPSGAESGISPIANVAGYAVVDVNMRGTGCSGGAFDYFERLQGLDGYDVVETVARQPWVKNNKVGMVGVSYGGISQLFVGATNPPSLAGITPLSVIDNTATTLYPGGMLNTGFALEWAEDRVDDAKPAGPNQGQPWAYDRIQGGDQTCAANQVLHTASPDLIGKVHRNRFYRPKVANPLNPAKFVHKIKMPVFLACQFNDEQTGGHCPNLVDRFTGTNKKWFTFVNGLHIDSLVPETFNRWFDFLELYVDQEKPTLSPFAAASAPLIYEEAMGVTGVTLPPDPIREQPDFDSAKRLFESQKPVRILFDSGGGNPGHPVPGFEYSFKTLPIPSTRAQSWFLGDAGTLRRKPPPKRGTDTFLWDKEARPADNFPGTNTSSGDLWTDTPSSDWRQPPAGTAASYITPPLGADQAIIGAGALRAWVRSSVPDVDLQVTVTEVRPDGKETYVQSGYLRTSMRKLDGDQSTLLEPVLSLARSDAKKMPKGRFAKLTIPLYYQGHMYRAGSRIRITIAAPSNDQPVWSFAETVPAGDANVSVAFAPDRSSRLILPFIPKVVSQTPLGQCPGLRGEPCRTYTGP